MPRLAQASHEMFTDPLGQARPATPNHPYSFLDRGGQHHAEPMAEEESGDEHVFKCHQRLDGRCARPCRHCDAATNRRGNEGYGGAEEKASAAAGVTLTALSRSAY